MPRVLYITCSAYSGSTLLSFLLNTHSDAVTVGHMMGWDFAAEDDFRCSCGEPLDRCPLFTHVASVLRESGVPFKFHDFGTRYKVVGNARLNGCLTRSIPYLPNTPAEKVRDALVRMWPPFSRRIARNDRANAAFIEAVLGYHGASVFVDNSHGPHRLVHLSRIPGFEMTPVHLVRDFRGVVLSNMKIRNWSAEFAFQMWLRQQTNIARILGQFERRLFIYYEDLCTNTNDVLYGVYDHLKIQRCTFDGNFRSNEHHILGNTMRLSDYTVELRETWKSELPARERTAIENAAARAVRMSPGKPVVEILSHYLNS